MAAANSIAALELAGSIQASSRQRDYSRFELAGNSFEAPLNQFGQPSGETGQTVGCSLLVVVVVVVVVLVSSPFQAKSDVAGA